MDPQSEQKNSSTIEEDAIEQAKPKTQPANMPNSGEKEAPPQSRTLISLLLFLLICVIAMGAYILLTLTHKTKPQPVKTLTQAPTQTPRPSSPSASLTPVLKNGQDIPTTWTTYPDSNFYLSNFRFYLSYPQTWKVNYQRRSDSYLQNSPFTRIEFDMLPPNAQVTPPIASQSAQWLGWGSMAVDIYPHPASVQDWINTYLPAYKTKVSSTNAGTIGNRQAYFISVSTDLPTLDPTYSTFNPLYLVIGQNYSYEITFSQNGQLGFVDTIKKTIWPLIHFD